MIKANELRIGNWVEYNETATLFQVTDIGYSGIGVKNKDEETWIELDQFSPVDLTPDILEKAGFEKTYDDFLKMDDNFIIDPEGYVYFERPDNITHIITVVRHVHQLQNLYLALTGEELTVNL